MSYENAPATRLVATSCVACGLPLVDPISVETGMGPICREKYGHAGPEGVTEEARADVAKRVHELAAGIEAPVAVGHLLIIRAHGFDRLADKLEERMCTVEIAPIDATSIALLAPYNEAFTADLKASRISWRRWDPVKKWWLLPSAPVAKNLLWTVIRRHFAGTIGRGPQGLFPIEEAPRG